MIDAPSVAVLALGAIATATDWTTRRIPNALTFGASAVAVAFAAATAGVSGVGWSVAGWVVGLLLFLPLFALRAMGGGDVKLLTALALWVPWKEFLELVLIMSVAGGILTVLFGSWHVMRRRKDRLAIPYGVAIAFAGLSVLYMNHFEAVLATSRGAG